ncbi:MAG: hypothetical protein LC775_11625, partial [Acidobacteria bacterium]|nr:hypothetical protein [Acidobacteriota bacterium]
TSRCCRRRRRPRTPGCRDRSDTDLAGVGAEIVDAVGNRLAQFPVLKDGGCPGFRLNSAASVRTLLQDPAEWRHRKASGGGSVTPPAPGATPHPCPSAAAGPHFELLGNERFVVHPAMVSGPIVLVNSNVA